MWRCELHQRAKKTARQDLAASRNDWQETQQPSEFTSQVTILPTVSEDDPAPPRGVEPLSLD